MQISSNVQSIHTPIDPHTTEQDTPKHTVQYSPSSNSTLKSTPQERTHKLHQNPDLLNGLKRKREEGPSKPIRHIRILGTGGTIAGTAKNKTQTSGYEAGKKNIGELLQEVLPDFNLPKHIHVSAQDVFQIDSKDLTDSHWLTLAQTVSNELEKEEVHGVVITHGTDTLAATSFFLNMTVHSKKPIVIVGSMRPATAISSDGPMNLNAAIRVAKSHKSIGNGVMVMANDKIYSASDVAKKHTTHVNAFQAENSGPMGSFANNKVYFHTKPARRHTADSQFNIKNIAQPLPATYILYSQVGQPQLTVQHIQLAVEQHVRGLIYAGTGDGTMHAEIEKKLREVVNQGVLVVRASKVGAGPVVHNAAIEDEEALFVSADVHNPDQSAILAKLALTELPEGKALEIQDIRKVQRLFKHY